MKSSRMLPLVPLVLLLPLLPGCRDGVTGITAAPSARDPAETDGVGLAVTVSPWQDVDHPLVVGSLASRREVEVHSTDGTSNTLMFSEALRLFEDGRAVGFASFSPPDEPSRRFRYKFETGRVACEAGMPVAYLRGFVRGDGRDEQVPFLVSIKPVAEGGRGERIDVLSWSWGETHSGAREGDHFVTEVRHLFFSPDICDAR